MAVKPNLEYGCVYFMLNHCHCCFLKLKKKKYLKIYKNVFVRFAYLFFFFFVTPPPINCTFPIQNFFYLRNSQASYSVLGKIGIH